MSQFWQGFIAGGATVTGLMSVAVAACVVISSKKGGYF